MHDVESTRVRVGGMFTYAINLHNSYLPDKGCANYIVGYLMYVRAIRPHL